MARLSDKEKDLILADYHTGDYSQRELAKKHNVSLGTINKLTKDINPQNEHLVNAQIALLKGQSELPNEQMNAVMNTANNKARRMDLVFGGLEKLAKRMNDTLDTNKKMDKLNVGNGVQQFEPVELNPQDFKMLAEGFEKVGKSLGIIEDKPSVNIENTNAQQNNELTITRINKNA